ncbi:MAG: hypothetical protein HOH43_18515 [Candidatus Latescibacteria bacterium]|jgi:lysophospholipase L1-like esterase|nr:hypothetical protein [Candidatus Latescibacterota bacterium]
MALKSVGVNLSIFGCTLLIVWGCLEVAFALAAPQVPIKEALLYAPHPVLRYVPNPGVDRRYRTTEFDTQVAFNSKGFRGPESVPDSSSRVFRILCLGDSFTLGAEVALEESYPYLLEEMLNQRSENRADSIRYSVLNGGVGGYGTFQELVFLGEFGLAQKPDLVLVQFYSNDVKDNLRYRAFWNSVFPDSSVFPVRDDVVAPVIGSVSGSVEVARSGIRTASILPDIKEVLEKNSHVYHFFRARINILKSTLGVRKLTDFDDFMVMVREPSPDIEEGWDLTRRLYLQMRDISRQNQASLVISVVPNKTLLARDGRFDEWIAAEGLDMTIPHSVMTKFGSESQIPVLDLLPPLREAGALTDLHYDWDGHWNASGHRAAAIATASFLEQQQLIPDREN